MKWLFLLTISIVSFSNGISQKYDYTWLLGYTPSTGYDPDSSIGFTVIPFGIGIENMFYKLAIGQPRNTNASICHPETGELLMYFDGCRIFNRDYEIMENGDSLFHGKWWKEWCDTGSKSYTLPRNGIFLPYFNEENKYILIHMRDTLDSKGIRNQQMRYSTIDFSENENGKVTTKANVIFNSDLSAGNLHVVKHANSVDWWAVTVHYFTSEIYVVLITENEKLVSDQQKFFNLQYESMDGGNMVFNPDGTKLAIASRFDNVHLLDFDRQTGVLSNHKTWTFPDSIITHQLRSQFSPNGRFLYVTNTLDLWQIDTWAEDLNASTVYIAEWDGLTIGGFFRTAFGEMVIGPDCKIYMGTSGTTRYMHVIHHPDLPGQACGFEMRGITLKAVNGHAMPLFPNYRLDLGPVCDPTLTSATHPVLVTTASLEVYPNPANSEVHVRLADSPPGGQLTVYDVSGREVYRHGWPGEQVGFSVSGWPSGMYFINYYSAEGHYASGRLLVE